MNALELIGKRVRYKGRDRHVRSVHAGRDRPTALTIKLREPTSEPDRIVDVPEYEWDKIEILPS